MKEFLIILFSAILVNNFVLTRFLGLCPFLGVSKNVKTAMGMSYAVIFVMILSTVITWPIFNYILYPQDLAYMQTVIFILVIASLVQITEMFLKKLIPPLYSSLGIFLPLITTNCAILGLTILNIDEGYSFIESIVHAIGAGVGFMLALFLFSGIRAKLDYADVPRMMKGLPIALVSASLIAIAFYGFKDLIEQLFG